MDFPLGSEDPAILRLHKWDLSDTGIRLLDFREAFLSPTREILLLHSHEREAILLPLSKGDCCFPLFIIIIWLLLFSSGISYFILHSQMQLSVFWSS